MILEDRPLDMLNGKAPGARASPKLGKEALGHLAATNHPSPPRDPLLVPSPGCSRTPEPRIPDLDSFCCELLKKPNPSHELFHHHGLVPHMAEPDVLELITLKSLTKPSAAQIGATMGTVRSPSLSLTLPTAH